MEAVLSARKKMKKMKRSGYLCRNTVMEGENFFISLHNRLLVPGYCYFFLLLEDYDAENAAGLSFEVLCRVFLFCLGGVFCRHKILFIFYWTNSWRIGAHFFCRIIRALWFQTDGRRNLKFFPFSQHSFLHMEMLLYDSQRNPWKNLAKFSILGRKKPVRNEKGFHLTIHLLNVL